MFPTEIPRLSPFFFINITTEAVIWSGVLSLPGKAKGYIKGAAKITSYPGASLPYLSSAVPKQRIKDWIFIIQHVQPPTSQVIPFSHIHAPSLYVYIHSTGSQLLIPKHPQNPDSLSFVFLRSNYLESPPSYISNYYTNCPGKPYSNALPEGPRPSPLSL